jgi:cytochrome P450
MHAYFAPESMEEWRPLVRSAIAGLLDAAEARGNVDLIRDMAVPLPVLVIAKMMGVPASERPHIRMLAEKLFHNNRSEPDRMRIVVEGIMGMND